MSRRFWQQVAAWVLIALVVGSAAALVLRPDPRDRLRQADHLFAAGRYRAALAAYSDLAAALSEASLRRGIVLTLRAEIDPARRALIAAIKAGLRPRDYQIALLYLGQLAALEDDLTTARRTWAMLADCAPDLCAIRDVLLASADLRSGDIEAASVRYQSLAREQLAGDWAEAAISWQTMLSVLRDPTSAPTLPPTTTHAVSDPLLRPLAPLAPDRATLAAALQSDAAARPQLLGQLALDLGYEQAALAFFAQVDPGGPHALAAAIYRAYAHLRLGDQEQGIEQLEHLAVAHPADPRIGPLLTLAYLTTGDLTTAAARIQRLRAAGAGGPAIELAAAGVALAARDFVAAADAYEQAVIAAPVADRARYVTLAARFHLDSGFERCTNGLQAAQAAASLLPADPNVLTILAGTRYYCGDPTGAISAAEAALAAGAGVEARFYYGMALGMSGQIAASRAALEAVADLAPASIWRQRAETALTLRGER